MARRVLLSIERLPEVARPSVDFAARRLVERHHLQAEIFDEFNASLKRLGLPAIPKSTFYRWAKRVSERAGADHRAPSRFGSLTRNLSPAALYALEMFLTEVRRQGE